MAGFDLLAEIDDGLVQLNDSLIVSPVVDSVTPTDYSFDAVTTASRFYLQEVGVNGGVVEHGPFEAGSTYGAYVQPKSVDLTPSIWLPLLLQ